MQDLNNVQFKRDNILLWLSLLKILSETKESESQYSVNMLGMIKIDRNWVSHLIFTLFFFIFTE